MAADKWTERRLFYSGGIGWAEVQGMGERREQEQGILGMQGKL